MLRVGMLWCGVGSDEMVLEEMIWNGSQWLVVGSRPARRGVVALRCGAVWRGVVRRGVVWLGAVVGIGAWRGVTWSGVEACGEAWRGVAWRGGGE